MSEWQPIETAPTNRYVLIFYINSCGQGITIKAAYHTKFFFKCSNDDEMVEYDEKTDTYYYQEGWCEIIDNLDDYAFVRVNEGIPTHWMPLPPHPKKD